MVNLCTSRVPQTVLQYRTPKPQFFKQGFANLPEEIETGFVSFLSPLHLMKTSHPTRKSFAERWCHLVWSLQLNLLLGWGLSDLRPHPC